MNMRTTHPPGHVGPSYLKNTVIDPLRAAGHSAAA